jgi:CBS domain-containing protein
MGKKSLVSDLISNELLPKAKKGLEKLNVNSQEIAYYLGVVKQRLEVHTGSQWTIKNYRALKKNSSQDHALLTLTKGIYENQRSGKSVAEWPDIQSDQHPKNQATKMGHIMSTTLITANQADSARLTVELMRWNNIHHLPVVDDQRNLVGLITWRHLDKYWE